MDACRAHVDTLLLLQHEKYTNRYPDLDHPRIPLRTAYAGILSPPRIRANKYHSCQYEQRSRGRSLSGRASMADHAYKIRDSELSGIAVTWPSPQCIPGPSWQSIS